MANSKQKPVPEGVKRSPGKSKFSIPRKEAPPIDGSYLDRLFADYDKQTKELEDEGGAAEIIGAESLQQPVAVEHRETEISEVAASPATPAKSSSSPPTPRSVPFPIEEKAPPDALEVESSAAPTVTPQHLGREVIPETQTPPTPPPVAELPTDDQELIQNLVKIHRLSKGEASVLRVMLRMCDEGGSDICYIKIPHLMAVTGLKDRQTQRVLKSLSELNLIERLAEYSNADRLGIKYRVIPFHS